MGFCSGTLGLLQEFIISDTNMVFSLNMCMCLLSCRVHVYHVTEPCSCPGGRREQRGDSVFNASPPSMPYLTPPLPVPCYFYPWLLIVVTTVYHLSRATAPCGGLSSLTSACPSLLCNQRSSQMSRWDKWESFPPVMAPEMGWSASLALHLFASSFSDKTHRPFHPFDLIASLSFLVFLRLFFFFLGGSWKITSQSFCLILWCSSFQNRVYVFNPLSQSDYIIRPSQRWDFTSMERFFEM